MIDAFGYIGTLLVALSFTCNSMLKLRLLNIIGASIITIYALIISAYPVAILDGLIVIINVTKLISANKNKI